MERRHARRRKATSPRGGQAVRGSDDGMVARRRRELKSNREVRLVLGSLAHALLRAGNGLAGRGDGMVGRAGRGLRVGWLDGLRYGIAYSVLTY